MTALLEQPEQPLAVGADTALVSTQTYDLMGQEVQIQVVTYSGPDGLDFIAPPVVIYNGNWNLTWNLDFNADFPDAQISDLDFSSRPLPPGITVVSGPTRISGTQWTATITGKITDASSINGCNYSLSITPDATSNPVPHAPSLVVVAPPQSSNEASSLPPLKNIYDFSNNAVETQAWAYPSPAEPNGLGIIAPPIALTNGAWDLSMQLSVDPHIPTPQVFKFDLLGSLPAGVTVVSGPTQVSPTEWEAKISGNVSFVNGLNYLISAAPTVTSPLTVHDPAIAVVKDPMG